MLLLIYNHYQITRSQLCFLFLFLGFLSSDLTLLPEDKEQHLEMGQLQQCLVVQVLTKSRFNKRAFVDMMHSLWGNSCSVHFKELNDTSFLCTFENMKDKERVIFGAPWHFVRALVLIAEVSNSVLPRSVSIHKALFWVQIHNFPLPFMTKSIGEAIGSHLGNCILVDSAKRGSCLGKFMRVRVQLDITKPLRRGMKIALQHDDHIWVEIQYEKLPDFCYRCGLLGYTLKDCVVEESIHGDQYGACLRANHSINLILGAKTSRQSPSVPRHHLMRDHQNH
nr:uncharacterized protein LOC125419422 [Ziziphus jujuba var. spinosa]